MKIFFKTNGNLVCFKITLSLILVLFPLFSLFAINACRPISAVNNNVELRSIETSVINTADTCNIDTAGNTINAFVRASSNSLVVAINPSPTLTDVTSSVVINVGGSVALLARSNGAVTWYDPQGNALPLNNTGILNAVGFYSYTVIASNGSRTTTKTITISVIDETSCSSLSERTYATTQKWSASLTGNVINEENAADGDVKTYSTLSRFLGLLDIQVASQNLEWSTTISKGTAVTVKLGSDLSGVTLLEGVSVVGTKRDALGKSVDIGDLQAVPAALLNLLSGQNSFEFTFVPSDGTGPKDYDGIRVQLGSLVSVLQSINIYDAYYKKQVVQPTCVNGDIVDVLYGVQDDLGIGALTATVGVEDAWNIADSDVSTYATMYSDVGVLSTSYLTTVFATQSIATDSLKIVISKPGALLSAVLLKGFSIQLYLGDTPVGDPIDNTNTPIDLVLLSSDSAEITIGTSQNGPYDRVSIRSGGVAGVLDYLRIHDIKRIANTKVIGSDINNKVVICAGSDVTLEVTPESCSDYVWYDALTGGNVVANGQTFRTPSTLTAGIHMFYIQPIRYGCAALSRGKVTVEITASTPENAISSVSVNGANVTAICAESGTVKLAVNLDVSVILTNPIYHWYSFNGSSYQLIVGETNSELIITGLASGAYTYSVGVSSDEYCPTAEADRKQISFTILPSSSPTDISISDVSICHDTDASLNPSSALVNPLFFWYFDANKTQAISDGLVVNGVTYTISSAGLLTASGLSVLMSPITYYVAVSSDNTCENIRGELKDVTVTVTDPNPPTGPSSQDFCLVDNPKVSDIEVNESNVVWYTMATGGTALAPTTALTSGSYYGAIQDAVTGCESSVRLLVDVEINDPKPPTGPSPQDFCLVDNPKVSDIEVVESNVVWYTTATGGTALSPTTALTSGSYYGAIQDSATGCKSAVRLLVTVTVSDPLPPTTNKSTQNFCLVDNPKVSDIEVNESNVVWYTMATGGTALAPTTALTTGSYYGAIQDSETGCESAVRLLVDVKIINPNPPTGPSPQVLCLVDNPKVSDIEVNELNVVWYTTATGGTALAPTTALTTGSYYGAIQDSETGCESAVRLLVDVKIINPNPPTGPSPQVFCLVDNPKVSDIEVNELNVVWYITATGGTALAPTTALTTGSYYGAIQDAATGCESAVRLLVDVKIINPNPPTGPSPQVFCLVDNPKVSDIEVNELNVVWYTTATGGTALAPTTALTTGSYYGAIQDSETGCESAVRLLVDVKIINPNPPTGPSPQVFCLVDNPKVSDIEVNELNVVWYTTATGGTALAPTTALTTGSYYGAIQDSETGCESAVRLLVDVKIINPNPPTGPSPQVFCLVDNPKVSDIEVNELNVVWYTTATGGTALAPTTALTTGSYYGAIQDSETGCESAVRLLVDVKIINPNPPTGPSPQVFCLVDNPKVSDIEVNELNVVWYTTATGGTALAPTTALTTGSYYGAIQDSETGCESAVRLLVDVKIINPNPPTGPSPQVFCLVDNPKVSDIEVNESNVVWYTTATGGTALAPTTALTTGSYYGAIQDSETGCESAVRLLVDVKIINPNPPTGPSPQVFCLVDNPKVSDIEVNELNVVWYTTATGGTALAPTTALTTGSYYGAIQDSETGCESAVRLLVDVKIINPNPPTGPSPQVFCLVDNPKVSDIEVNELNVVWYTTATGGTALAPTTALTTGSYYGAIQDSETGCESAVRLLVDVKIINPNPPTGPSPQVFCLVDNPKVSDIEVNELNVVWYTTATGGTALAPTTALTTGSYYGAIQDSETGCESAVRLLVDVKIINPNPPTGPSPQVFCLVDNPKVSDIEVNELNVVWYTTATGGTALAPTTALTTGSYYGAIQDSETGCESAVRLLVDVKIINPNPPTGPSPQVFCLVDNPKVSDIEVNELNVVWYTTATGGTALAPTTALTTGSYYGAIQDSETGCESAFRLLVDVKIINPNPPTGPSPQVFCLVDNPKVSDIEVVESNVVWYTMATGGTALAPTTALTTGSYYGAIQDAATGCESAVRLLVDVTITDPKSPTGPSPQVFCLVDNPKVSDIEVNESNVAWYTTATGGTALAPTTALTTGSYYGAIQDAATGCESAVRLAIQINFVEEVAIFLNDSKASPCIFEEITYTTLDAMSNYNWTVIGGDAVAGGSSTDNFVTVRWLKNGEVSVAVSYSNLCNEVTSKKLDIVIASCSDLSITQTVDNPTPARNENVTFTITVYNKGTGNVIDIVINHPLPSGYSFVSASTTRGAFDSSAKEWKIPTLAGNQEAELKVVGKVLEFGDYISPAMIMSSNPPDVDESNNYSEAVVTPICLVVYNMFTPNNDGLNDVFKIECIENYPNNKLSIYNRYGQLVYRKENYNNDWDGIANVSGVIDREDKLPSGTYYYVIEIGNGEKAKAGWLSIVR